MRLFSGRGTRRRLTEPEMRAEIVRLTRDNQQLVKVNAAWAARDKVSAAAIAELEKERGWFHDRWIEVGEKSIEDGEVIAALELRAAELKITVTKLEEIAGPLVDPEVTAETASPIFAEVVEARSGDVTQNIRVTSLAKADLVGAL
ncbi:hypothetical protein QMK19_03205 [Streptomyces sp. H10-C2]|uniref:hypothetical protein n=1 Tax=unclassified Streptomyces TaxID=2593676 RepID=UPI0024B9A86E|nr:MULTISPECIES: hypothetical protein [unclassified Streptomyces]MDJ0342193.1 hypothetical protein [Streptomyces sp. PH10-H1]MDJ0368707.1 hypothetical protein [Streptomyces sp. H10-C2]